MTARPMRSASVRKAYASKGDDATLSRWVKVPGEHRAPGKPKQRVLGGLGHPTVEAGRSIFYRKGVHPVGPNPLVSGHNNVKIGRDVRKGRFRGYWIYTLSLEERATCPRSCAHWHDCYGNNMPWAKRYQHGPELEAAIVAQIERLMANKKRRGILVRLHALGDFYSVDYVHFWGRLLRKFPRLAVFGYTARAPGTPIGDAVFYTQHAIGARRFAVRWSDGARDWGATVSIVKEEDCPSGAFVCPEQTGKTLACATCGACWGTSKNVAFIGH